MNALLHRILWHVNRSPLGKGVQAGVSLFTAGDLARRRRAAAEMPMDAALRSKADFLNENGYVALDGLMEPALLGALQQDAEAKAARAREISRSQSLTHKNFWVRLLDEDMKGGAMGADSIYARYALQAPVLSVLSAAFGQVPILDYVLLTLSQDTGSAERIYSQNWHRDHDNPRTVKLFTYLSDVREDGDGPFTFIPGPASDTMGPTLRSHMSDEKVFGRIDRGQVREMKAPKLSTFIVETSRCLHMGSRMGPGRTRLMYTATFLRAPRVFPRSKPFFRDAGGLDEMRRLALES